MFERYTENARRTIFFARSEANQYGSSSIEPEHLLLSLLRDNWLKDSFLRDLSEPEFRAAIVTGASISTAKQTTDIPLSDISKRILNHSAEEADLLSDSHIGTEHLLLGVLREKRCGAAHALNKTGLRIKDVRKLMRQIPREERKLKGMQVTMRSRLAGVPEGYSFCRLLYNAVSETVIVELQKHDRTWLIARHKNKEDYDTIGNPPDDISYESAVTCDNKPILIFNSIQRTESGGGFWQGVYIFDILTQELTPCVSKENFIPPNPYKGGWIANILSLSDDASHAYVKTGLEMHFENGMKMNYYVARINLKTRELELISHLKKTFL